jgi:hypothetical protein
VGVGGVESYVGALLQPSNSPVREMLGFSGLFGSTLGPGRVADLLTIAGGAAAVVAAWWVGARARRDPTLLEPAIFAATALSLLASPHLLGHDLTLLAPVLVAALGWLAVRARSWPDTATAVLLAAWILLSGLALLDLAGEQAGGSGIRLVPWVLICLGFGTAATLVRSGGGTASPSPTAPGRA